jgi:4-hydroxy-2-oxoheptanedioate aldolase
MNRIRQVWAEGRSAVVGWLHVPSAFSAEIMARAGYDGLVIDIQHGAASFHEAHEMLRAIELGGAEPLARVTANDPGEIMKLLDYGCYGVICPMIETAEEAAAFASSIHYPPQGRRSYGPRRPAQRYGAGYVAMASETIVSFAMIETELGLVNLDRILAVEGYDGVFIGPADLALALGHPPKPDPDAPVVVEAIRHIRERAHAMGKKVGLFCADGAYAKARIAEGFDMVSIAPDSTLLVAGAKASLDAARG